MDLNTPQFTQPTVLQVTRVKPLALQNWTNRKAIELAVQNPGYGKSRLYSALDIVKIAIMRRLADLRVDLAVAKHVAEATATIVDDAKFDNWIGWDAYLFMRPNDATQPPSFKLQAMYAGERSDTPFSRAVAVLDQFGFINGLSPEHWRLTQIAFHWGGGGIRRSATTDPHGKIDDDMRRNYATQGFHAEPVIIFPLGEIVRGTLLQVEALGAATPAQTVE